MAQLLAICSACDTQAIIIRTKNRVVLAIGFPAKGR
jgi:hypothetical protein